MNSVKFNSKVQFKYFNNMEVKKKLNRISTVNRDVLIYSVSLTSTRKSDAIL